jgi:hypothetical protein
MSIKKKECTESNATSNKTVEYSYNHSRDWSIDECIHFCLQQARDDKSNSDMYLKIIKYLLDKCPVTWHYQQQPWYPNITYTNNDKKVQPEWDEIYKVTCDHSPELSISSSMNCLTKEQHE